MKSVYGPIAVKRAERPRVVPALYIIRGLPGSGKSTLAKDMIDNQLVTNHFEADMFHMVDGEYAYKPANVGKAHKWCQQSVCESLSKGIDTVVANTFVTLDQIKPYLEFDLVYVVTVITLTSNFDNIHNVPTEVIEKMKNLWEVTSPSILRDMAASTIDESYA